MNVSVIEQQSLFDISISKYGSINQVFKIGLINNIAITDALIPGDSIVLDDTIINNEIVNYITSRSIEPATGLKNEDVATINDRSNCCLCEHFK